MVDRQKKGDQETIHRTKDNAVIRVVQDKYDGRRKFEVLQAPDNPEELAQEKEREAPRTLKNLEGRSTTLNLDAQVGKVQIINKDNTSATQSGFYCKHCDALMKDSNAWLDHINGVKHNKALGMNMKVERVGVDKVRERLQGLKKATSQPITSMEDFEKKFEEEQKRKAEKALKDKTHRKQLKTENAVIEAKLQELESEIPEDLGIPLSFGSSKKR